MSLGKKITCPFCKTKLFTFNKINLSCPHCKKKISPEKKNEEYDNLEDDVQLDDLSDEELLNKVIPSQFYEIIEILNLLDKNSHDIPEVRDNNIDED
jgi:uncharacterized Zn finger protein (UPF0148 family)